MVSDNGKTTLTVSYEWYPVMVKLRSPCNCVLGEVSGNGKITLAM